MKENKQPKNRKTVYFLLTILLVLTMIITYSCSGTKQTINETDMNQIITELTTNFDVSAKTRQLIKDMQDELTEQKINIKKYTPSKNVVEKYDILKIEDVYHISGMMMTKENFIKSTLDNISVKAGSQSGKFTTVQIPVNNFDLFLKNEGIKYFQVTEKVKTN